MSRFAQASIANIALALNGVPCRCLCENESAFASTIVGNSVTSADGTPHSQLIDREQRGIDFAIRIAYCPETLLTELVGALNTALAASLPVRVEVESLTSFDVLAMPRFVEGKLFTFDSRSGNYAKNVVFNFVSVGAYE